MKFLKLLCLSLLFIPLTGCGNEVPEQANALIAEADAGSIEYKWKAFRPNSGDFVNFDREGLKKMQGLVGNKPTGAFKCAYDGTIVFKKGEETLISFDFNIAKDCAHLAFTLEGELYHYEINPDILASLRKDKPAPAKLSEVEFMLGEWAQQEAKGKSWENWSQAEDGTYRGEVFTVTGADTNYLEKLKIEEEDGLLYYTADVSHNDAPVRFQVNFLGENRVMFENRDHDFPQLIIYQKKGADTLHARIEGLYQGQPVGRDFYLIAEE